MMLSRKKLIDSHCASCIYDPTPGNGTRLSQIANCTSFSCDLWPARPKPRDWSDKKRSSLLAREKHCNGVVINPIERDS